MTSAEVEKPLPAEQVFPPFAPPITPRNALREAITAHTCAPEADCLAPLLQRATFDAGTQAEIADLARRLVVAVRGKPKAFSVGELIQESGWKPGPGFNLPPAEPQR